MRSGRRPPEADRSATSFERWRALVRLLPAEVRERVFEPAFSDLMYGWLTAPDGEGASTPFAVQALGTYLDCFPIAIPRLVYRNGHITRFGKVTVWTVSGLVLLAVAVTRMASAYAEYPPIP